MKSADPASRLAAALADRYRIERELGAGGMATVYLAADLRHERNVALKVLRPELAAVIGADRFLKEIKVTANLQHPHILGLIDSGEVDGLLWYAMPFVQGESLRDRLQREKQLPIADALRIASEVAAALDYAHRHGVIHRDIKPENILLHDGSALVADFGIALAASSAGTRMTETGMSLGTPHYMSPEQAMGEREITARSDVYALGCITYEMLTGDPPFTGSTAQAIVAKVITERAHALSTQRHTIPPHVEAAVLTALEKLPADRFATAAEFAAALVDRGYTLAAMAATAGAKTAASPSRDSQRWRRAALALCGVTAIALLSTAYFATRAAPPDAVRRFSVGFDKFYVDWAGVAIARDGQHLVYFAAEGGMFARTIDQLDATKLPGTADAWMPTFSPDGKELAFNTGAPGAIKVLSFEGGATRTLVADSTFNQALSWSEDNWIYYQAGSDYGRDLMRIRPDGSTRELIARADAARNELQFSFPHALPGGKKLLVTVYPVAGDVNIGVLDIESGAVEVITPGFVAVYAPSGHIVVHDGVGQLKAARFNPNSGTLIGGFTTMAEGVHNQFQGLPPLALSDEGTLVYQTAPVGGALARVSRDGSRVEPLDPDWTADAGSLALSPDGSNVAVSLIRGGRQELWVKSLVSGALSRLAAGGTLSYRPAWSPDGRTLLFTSDAEGTMTTYSVAADGSAPPRRVMPGYGAVDEALYSKDGEWLVFRTGSGTGRNILARRTRGDTSVRTIAAGPSEEFSPALSPDGKWIAYGSDESGRTEIYVRPFPDAERARYVVSRAGGSEPMWAHSGRELFFRDATGNLNAVPVDVGDRFSAGPARVLFNALQYKPEIRHRFYSVSPDDNSFIFARTGDYASGAPLVVTLNWFEELKRRVP